MQAGTSVVRPGKCFRGIAAPGLALLAFGTAACASRGAHGSGSRVDTVASIRVTLQNGSAQVLSNAVVTADSVIGGGKPTTIRYAYPRAEVRSIKRRNFGAGSPKHVALRDGQKFVLRNIQVTADSVTGVGVGTIERLAIARTDVRRLQRNPTNVGLVALTFLALGLAVLISISTMSLQFTPN
jgi:hypothetical protein